jgi:hypothetical protein
MSKDRHVLFWKQKTAPLDPFYFSQNRQLKSQIDSHMSRGCRVEGIALDGGGGRGSATTTTTLEMEEYKHHSRLHHERENQQLENNNPDSTCLS